MKPYERTNCPHCNHPTFTRRNTVVELDYSETIRVEIVDDDVDSPTCGKIITHCPVCWKELTT